MTLGTSRLVWSDEFEGAQGTPPDPLRWGHERGGDGWGNRELQCYTDLRENSVLDGNSCLAITASMVSDADPVHRTCWYGPCRFTSARLVSRGRCAFTYGLVEARIKVPFGQGIWPAFWMLGENFGEVGWPACGEIDVMENIGREPGIVHGTVHLPGYSGANGISGMHGLPTGQALKDAFHIYAVEWQPGIIRWYMDNHLYFEVRQATLPKGTPWPFQHPFYLLLNVAVGGEWPGAPDETTVFPQVMLIDYVRVHQTRRS
jgi:beta-glucanase (GH16 family)